MLNQLHVVKSMDVSGESLAALRYAHGASSVTCIVTLLSQGISMKSDEQSFLNRTFEQQFTTSHKNFFLNIFSEYRQIWSLCESKKFDLIHLHGMWSPLLVIAALIAKRKGITLIISPHGGLEPWALRNKYYKKLLAMKIYQSAILRSASLLVATADQELWNLRKLGYQQPIAVLPHGVYVDMAVQREMQNEIKTFLFLSRIHPVKGLLDLVEAWAIVKQSGWRIVIAGADVEEHLAIVKALIRKRDLESDFEFCGFVDGERKQACFDQADVFILPTHSENFGIVIAEALANELPVITTTAAPWSDLVQHRCGWWVKPGVTGISSAMVEAMAREPSELKQMGHRGRQLVVAKYSWEKIGITIQEVNEWVLDQARPKPEVVDLYEHRKFPST